MIIEIIFIDKRLDSMRSIAHQIILLLIIFMIGGSEEAIAPSQYTFSLRAIPHKKNNLPVVHDFKPIQCEKTLKLRSTIPSYHSEYALPFQPDAALPENGLEMQEEKVKQPPFLMVAKPSAKYCQVCKERFEDYLKHTSHPLHLQKVREARPDLDLNLIKELLNKPQTKRKCSIVRSKPVLDCISQSEKTSMKDEEENFEESFLFGSKKRIVMNTEGEIEALSLSGSTKGIEDEEVRLVKKGNKNVPVSKKTLI